MSINLRSQLLLGIALFYTFLCQAQTVALKARPSEEIDEMFTTRQIETNSKGRHFKNRFIYVSNNEAYITMIPYLGYHADSLLYKFPNVPTFSYLKDFDVFILKNESNKVLLTREEFTSISNFKPTQTVKNYYDTKATKYVTDNNFYELELWVAEGTSNVSTHPFLNVLNGLEILNLKANQRVVAIEYLGLEFPIEAMVLEHEHRKNLNPELFEEDEEEQEETQSVSSLKIEEVEDLSELKNLLNKDYRFDSRMHYDIKNINDLKSKQEINIYINSDNDNRLRLMDSTFILHSGDYELNGSINTDGTLELKSANKFIDYKREVDLKNFKVIWKKQVGDHVEMCIQKTDDFWTFRKYVINTKVKSKNKVKYILPNKEIISGQALRVLTFEANYNRGYMEYLFDVKRDLKLEQPISYYLHD